MFFSSNINKYTWKFIYYGPSQQTLERVGHIHLLLYPLYFAFLGFCVIFIDFSFFDLLRHFFTARFRLFEQIDEDWGSSQLLFINIADKIVEFLIMIFLFQKGLGRCKRQRLLFIYHIFIIQYYFWSWTAKLDHHSPQNHWFSILLVNFGRIVFSQSKNTIWAGPQIDISIFLKE